MCCNAYSTRCFDRGGLNKACSILSSKGQETAGLCSDALKLVMHRQACSKLLKKVMGINKDIKFLGSRGDPCKAGCDSKELHRKIGSDSRCWRQNTIRISFGKEPFQLLRVVNTAGSSAASIASLDNL
nr:hypothetical protein Iba_chr15aCG5730 [Ipomoea batatas]